MSEAIASAEAEAPALPEAESAGVAAQSEGASDAQAVADSIDPVKAKAAEPVVEEDPEIDLGEAKFKKSELARLASKRKELDRAAFQKFERAAALEKQLAALKESDPEEYFKLRGVDPIQYAVERLQREVAMKEATPEQRAMMEMQARVDALEAEKQEYAQQQEQAQHQAIREQFVAKLDKELPIAVQKQGLPTDPLVFRAVASVLADQINAGHPEDTELAAEIVADAYRATFKQHAATLNFEALQKQYPEIVKMVREGDLARAKSATAPARPVAQTNAPKKPTEPTDSGAKKFNAYFDDWAHLGVQRG